MSIYAKQEYLVNSHQARNFADAGRKLSHLRRRSQPPAVTRNTGNEATAYRAPYKDE